MPPPRSIVNFCQGQREASYRAIEILYSPLFPGLSATAINLQALTTWAADWPLHPSPYGQGNFPWPTRVAKFRARASHFEIALWSRQTLCGLALAKSTGASICVHYVEGYHGPNPLDGVVGALTFEAAEYYGKARGKSHIRLMNPSPGVIPHYKRLGFTLEKSIAGDTFYHRPIQ